MTSLRKTAVVVFGLLFILTAVVAVAFVVGEHGSNQPIGSTLALGILSSLIAAAIASGIATVLAARAPSSEHRDTARRLRGLNGVAGKNALSTAEWLELLTSATHEFYVAGHSLGKWCSATNRDAFTSNIRRVLDGGGSVTLVMLDLNSPQLRRLQQATGTDYSHRIRQSMRVLADFERGLPESQRSRLRISVLKDHLVLPYMVVGNERRLLSAAYLAGTESDAVPCLDLDRQGDAGIAIYDDFSKLAEEADTVDLSGHASAGVADPPAAKPALRLRQRLSRRGRDG
jgi:hypothetical protein